MLLILGSFNIAKHIHIKWLSSRCSLIATNAAVKTILILIVLIMAPAPKLFSGNFTQACLAILLGLIFGYVIINIEIYLTRIVNRQRIIRKNLFEYNDYNFLRNATCHKVMSLSTTKLIHAKGFKKVRKNINLSIMKDLLDYSLLAVITVAITEEILFRGFAFTIAKLFTSYTVLVISMSIITFSLSHLSNSWREFVGKISLSLLTSFGYLITNSLATAIIAHVTFNIFAYLHSRRI